MNSWVWAVQHGVTIVVTLLLGAVLGNLQFFQKASLGSSKLTASSLVQFLAYGGALLLLWLAARRAEQQISESGTGLSFLRHTVVPFATLIVTSVGYQVVLLVVGPFLGKEGSQIYQWVFVIGITAVAGWLGLACYQNAGNLASVFAGTPSGIRSAPCPQCGAAVSAGAKFCAHCGSKIAQRSA